MTDRNRFDNHSVNAQWKEAFFPFNGDPGQMLHTLFTPLANMSKLVIFFGVQHHSEDSCIQILCFFFLLSFLVCMFKFTRRLTLTGMRNWKLINSIFYILLCYRDQGVTLLFLKTKHKLLT